MELLQHVIILFWTLAAGLSRQPPENLRHEAACLTQCAEHGVPNLPPGSRLSYRYSASTHTFLQGIDHKRSGVTLESTVIVEVLAKCRHVLRLKDVQIKTAFESREELFKDNDRLRQALERHPLWFCFYNGKIPKIFPQHKEPTWALNIKRGVLSVLQASAANSHAIEVDVLGECPTRYQQKGAVLLKTKDLNLCAERFSEFTALRSVGLPGVPVQEKFLLSKLECVQRFEAGVLAEAKCAESNLITPSARSSGGANTQSQTTMKLFRREAGRTIERGDIHDIYESNLLYEKEKPGRWPSEEETANILQKLCVVSKVDSESADLFMTLVFELRALCVEELLSLWQRSLLKCRHNWQPLMDALPACATEACVVLMKEMIVSGEVDGDQIESFLWSLAFVPEPTAGMIVGLAPLLQPPGGRTSAFLAITALVHHFCSMRDVCDQEPAVQSITRILGGYLEKNCDLQESERTGQAELVLKAIGNMGLAGTPLASLLSSCASQKRNPMEIRLAAVEAFRRVPCAANRTVLVRLYQTYEEDVEIRIAAYLASIKCPSEELFNQIKWTLQEEKSSQVGSFVWSHLSQILETNDPLKQDLKSSLPDDILSQEFDLEAWKFSSYSDATFHSASASANAEAWLIFSPASFIPRMIATNLTVYVSGRAVNLLELDIRLENVEGIVQKFFGIHPIKGTKGRHSKVEPPAKPVARKTQQDKQTSRRNGLQNDFPSKESKSKLRKEHLSCPGKQYNKTTSEAVRKFTKRMGKRKEPKCNLSIKIFGNELLFFDCGDLRRRAKHYHLSLAELGVKLLKGQEVQFSKYQSLATEQLLFPTISGLPVLLALNASVAINVTLKGSVNFKQRNSFFVDGYIKPSAAFQISAQMGSTGTLGQAGLKWETTLRSSTSLDGGIQVKKGKEFNLFLNTHEDSMDIAYLSSQLFVTKADGPESVNVIPDETETKSCTDEEVSKAVGWQLCAELSVPGEEARGFPFPVPGPIKAAVTLKKQDRRLHQYFMKAAYNISQKGSWIPDEAGLHFFMGTPKSELRRDIVIDFHFHIPQKKFAFEFIQPRKKLQMNGKIEVSKNSRVGHLELIVDDRSLYYVKGRLDLQATGVEQRYMSQLEAKLLERGGPIVLSGNITKHPGKKTAVSVTLVNLLKDAVFFSVCWEKKAGDTLKQYSLEGETYVPGILGAHLVGLMQHRGNHWSSALRIKYGLFADAKNFQQECNTGQKLKVENGLASVYKLDFDHEFHCTQFPAYSHKVHLRHEEAASELHSKLEVNYGKHWDEINNKKRVLVSQAFKNHSNPTLTSYFMEFTVHVPEKEMDYRTQLRHSHSARAFTESSTHFKVQYNNRLPFVAGLQWKDSSRYDLWRWEGTFNVDTPWLYFYAAHKLHQPQRSTYSATVEFTAGKAFVVKGLAVEIFCKDEEGDKEGRLWIHTPTATYLRISTVNRFEKDSLHSQNEMVSPWNQPVKNEIRLENSEHTKSFHFKIKSAKQEFNITSAYIHLEMPKKTKVSVRISWTDQKNLPVMLDVEAQIEEVRKEKMFYQKQGILRFRNLFKLPIPHSFLLQETFTVDKKEKHYYLETKVLINGLEESVQTLTLGYQTENPYICAALTHPYSNKLFPRNTEVCFMTRHLGSAKCEVEATLKTNQKEVLCFLGKYQKESSMASSQHLLQLEAIHLFQIQFPHSVVMNGELFSQETKLGNFDWGLYTNVTVNRQDISQFSVRLNKSGSHLGMHSKLSHLNQATVLPSFQAHATTERYGGSGFNGSFYLHSSGRDLVLLEADFEARENPKSLGMSIFLRQEVLTQFRDLWVQLLGKISPSRIMLHSAMKISQNSFHLGIVGAKEEKVGLMLAVRGSIQHDVGRLRSVIPQDLSLNGSLKYKNNIHEGAVSLMVDQLVYRLHIWKGNVPGNSSIHNITVALAQNSSGAWPAVAKLRGHLELNEELRRGVASIELDKNFLHMEVSNVNFQEKTRVMGTLTHNISALSIAGLPAESSITAMYGHINANQTVTLKLLGGRKRMSIVFGMENLHLETLQIQLTARLTHNIMELKNHGVPFTVEGVCYYQHFSNKLAGGLTLQAEEELVKVELEIQETNRTAGFALCLRHDAALLLQFIPPVLRIQCDGEPASNQLTGHCRGEIASRLFEPPARILLNGSVLANSCAADLLGGVASNDTFVCDPEFHVEVSLRHNWSFLSSLGLAPENQIKIGAARGSLYQGLLEITLGDCELTGTGELKAEEDGTTAEWRIVLSNKCDFLEKAELPQNLASGGSFLIKINNVSLTVYLRLNSKTAGLQLELSSADKYTIRGTLSHSFPHLRDLGLPLQNSVLLFITNGSTLEGLLSLNAGSCRVEAQGDLRPDNRTEWTLEMEADCKILQDLNIASHSQLTGSIQKDGCRVEFLSALRSGGKEARFEVKSQCQPKITVEVELRHELWLLRGIPAENRLSVRCGKPALRDIRIDLKSGPCELQANVSVHAENRSRWQAVVETLCQGKATQGLRIPIKMDGSGHIVMEKASLDSRVLVTPGDSSLQGLLTLTITNTKQELHILLTHSIQGAIHLGIPEKTVVDLISQKSGAIRRRFLRFRVDDKEIAEELSFTAKPDHVSLKWKITHNLESLRALWVEDQLEFQAAAVLKDVKQLTMKVQFDSCWIMVGGQVQKTNGKINLTGTFQHRWSQLLLSGIPEGIQMMVSFEANATKEKQRRTVAGQTLITYLPSAIPGEPPSDPFCCIFPEDAAPETFHSMKAINLTFMLQKLEKTAKIAFQGQHNNKSMIVAMEVFTGFGMHGSFQLTTEVKHSLSHLEQLGLPFSVKLTLFETLSENKTEGALKVVCDPDFSLVWVLNAKSELQSKELQIKCLHNMPVLLPYFPNVAEISSKVSYSTKEAEGKLSVQTENTDFQVLTKLTFTRTNHTQVLQLMHTVPQLAILPEQLVLMTGYQINKKRHIWRGTALWNNSKEIKLIGTYRGLFPKLSGGHNIKVEICHPLSIPFPPCSMLNVHMEHSARGHRDNLTIGWDDKQQVLVSSSLTSGKERVDYRARVVHPFNFTLSHVEVSSLTKSRRGNYNQQLQLGWNGGQASHVKLAFKDKSKANITLWDACVTASSSQLQDILRVGGLQACGSIRQTPVYFHQHLDVKWDHGRRIKQNLTYEKSKPLHLDKIQLEAILENVFWISCSNQNILGKVETDYASQLHYYTNIRICGLPDAIAFSGKHQLNRGGFFLRSEGKLSLAGDEGSITVALRNQSDAEVKNYSMEFALKAREALSLDLMGSLTTSAVQSQVLLEAKIDAKEHLKLAASKGKACLRYYMGYLKGEFEDGLELSACADGRHRAALNAYLVVNGVRLEDMGQLALEATRQNLTLNARGCGNPLLKAESKLNEIASNLQHRLAAKIKSLEEQLWEFRRSVRHVEFLYETAGWLLKVSQEVAGVFQNGLRGATQMWRQSRVRQALQKHLPLYLGKIQDFVQQMQNELQKPIRTLKDAYYDVTLKSWDEVWQERTEEYLRKLQALVPTVIKEAGLMEPIQISLRTLKTSLDVATQKMLSWAEAKFSKAVTKIQKPLSNMYSFSARNCSVTLRLPVLPAGAPTLNPANVANHLVEEQLVKPFCNLYDINLVAEYYRFKRAMMESPFEHHAVLMGNRHLLTFDGKLYSLTSKCSVLLAKDFAHNTFTIVLNQDSAGERSLYVVMDGTTVIIYPEQKTYKKYNNSLMEENCQSFDVPFEEKDIAAGTESDRVQVSSTNGASFSCDLRYDICTLTLEGWHHGASAGLFGTNDNEAGNEWMLPDGSYSASIQEFTRGWQMSSQCSPAKEENKPCHIKTNPEICKTFFQDSTSFFRNCFKVVDPEPFYKLCIADMCALQSVRAVCTLAAAFVHLCNRNLVPLEMPPQCDGELRLRDTSLPKALQ